MSLCFVEMFCAHMQLASIRALNADIIPHSQQSRVAANAGLMIGFAFLVVNSLLLACYELDKTLTYLDIYPYMSIGVSVLNVCLLVPTLLIAKEEQLTEAPPKCNIFK